MIWIEDDSRSVGEMMCLLEFLTPSVFLTRDGVVGSAIHLKSEALTTESQESIRSSQGIWHRLVTQLASNEAILVTEYRRKIELGVDSDSYVGFVGELMKPQLSGEYYQHDLFMTILCKPCEVVSGKRLLGSTLSQLMIELEKLRNMALSLLTSFNPTLLSNHSGESVRSLTDLLGLLVNAGYISQPFVMSKSLEPHFLGDQIANNQLLFGKEIEYLGVDRLNEKWGAIVSIKKYPPESELLRNCLLNQLDFEWIRVQSFEPLEKESALRAIQRQRSKLKSASDQSVSQREELEQLEDQLAGDSLSLGFHQYAILVLANDAVSLNKRVTALQARLIETGYGCVREALGLELAFWGMQAGTLSQGPRKALITSVNFSHLCPIRGFASGHRGDQHLGKPICLLETQEKMPYFFNFHVPGSRENPSLGHTLILGASNSGKTVLLTYLDAMRSRLGGKRFYFDRDLGAYLYIKAMNGCYLQFDPKEGLGHLNPFALADSERTRRFLTDWLEQMALGDYSGSMPAEDRSKIRACVDYAYDYLEPKQRFLSNALRLLPIQYPYEDNLKIWLKQRKDSVSGEYASYFDNENDELNFSELTGFDMTYLLDQAPAVLRKLTLMYLFYRVEMSCDGSLITLFLDEGWQYFKDPYWENKMRSWLPTLRKLNAHVVMATQSPSAILDSGIKDIFIDNCATQIYFSNNKARESIYQDAMRLTKTELMTIRSLHNQDRWFLLKHAEDSVVARLNLSDSKRFLPILSSHIKTCREAMNFLKNGSNSADLVEFILQERKGEQCV